MINAIGGPPDPGQPDGRQSARASEIARGTGRLLKSRGVSYLAELSLPNHRRADMVALGARGEIWIIEIKSSLADFQVDRKWPDYLDYCDQFYFAVGPTFPLDVLPEDVGTIIADRYGAEIMNPAPLHLVAAARRKVLTLRFAAAAASRLQEILDPDAALERQYRD